jgi:DNA-3-methyladenine glycosylase I
MRERVRCAWAASGEELDAKYHDEEWGVPSFDERHLFELLSLEGAQAGLSWSTILKKRDGYRRAFAGFDAAKVARFPRAKVAALLRDPGIVRHRQKIESVVSNAAATLRVRREFGSFAAYLWSFVDGKPLQGERKSISDLPSKTIQSIRLSKDLLARGFRFVGPTICYAFMQAVGMVNDHELGCFRHEPVKRQGGRIRIKSTVR